MGARVGGIVVCYVKRRAHAKRRDDNEPEIVAALEKIPGVSVYRLDDPADLLVGYRNVCFLFEVKNPETHSRRAGGGSETDDQIEFSKTWTGHYQVVETVLEIINTITGRNL